RLQRVVEQFGCRERRHRRYQRRQLHVDEHRHRAVQYADAPSVLLRAIARRRTRRGSRGRARPEVPWNLSTRSNVAPSVLRLIPAHDRTDAQRPQVVEISPQKAKSRAATSGRRYERRGEMEPDDGRADSWEDRILAHADALYGLARRLLPRAGDAE